MIHIYIHIESAKVNAADTLSSILKRETDASKPVLLLVSGGSALPLLNSVHTGPISNLCTISVLDERYSADPMINNFLQLSQTSFFSECLQHGAQYIDTSIQNNETQQALATRFEQALRSWRTSHPSGTIITTQGIGSDGHTSGIMPYPENETTFSNLFCSEQWITSYDATGKNEFPLRITTTIPFLKLVDVSIVYACGSNKKEPLERVLQNQSLASNPASIINEMKEVYLFTDQNIHSTLES